MIFSFSYADIDRDISTLNNSRFNKKEREREIIIIIYIKYKILLFNRSFSIEEENVLSDLIVFRT